MTLSVDNLEKIILFIRGQKVILDEDLAVLYSVQTKVLVQSVKRNSERFPNDFAFQLSYQEVRSLRSQIVTSNPQPSNITDNSHHGGRRSLPLVFTEQGVAMLSSVLNSPRAAQVNIEIVRTFVRLRQIIASSAELAQRLNELEKKYDSQFRVVFDAIRQLMIPGEVQKKGKLGF